MEKVSTTGRVFKCATGEQVTLSFVAHNVDMRITYRFDDEAEPKIVQGDSLTFPVTKELTILRVFFHFINEGGTGGSYDITLAGSLGGNFPDKPPVKQSGVLVPVRRYAFAV
ncbi:MAG: hypothetical protein ABI698_09805 [bacterium]